MSMLNVLNKGKGSASSAGGILSYFTNIKGLVGLAAIGLSLYMIFTDFPTHWEAYFNKIKEVETLKSNKTQLIDRLEQIEKTSQNIKPVDSHIYVLTGAETPQLATLKLAQQVVEVAKTEGNQFVKLSPGPITTVDYDKVIDIPIPVDNPQPAADPSSAVQPPADQGAPAAPQTGAGAEVGAVPADGSQNPAPTAGADATQKADPETSLQAAQYVLIINGTESSILKFVNAITALDNLIFISKIKLYRQGQATGTSNAQATPDVGATPDGSGMGGPSTNGKKGKKLLELELTFLVPWRLASVEPAATNPAPPATPDGTPAPPATP